MRKHNCLVIFTPPQSLCDRRKNSSAAMFTTRRNNSHSLFIQQRQKIKENTTQHSLAYTMLLPIQAIA